KIHNCFFKSAYLLHQSVLGLLGSEDFFLNFYDPTAAGSVVDFLNLLRQIKCGSFQGTEASRCFARHNLSPSYELTPILTPQHQSSQKSREQSWTLGQCRSVGAFAAWCRAPTEYGALKTTA